MPRLIPPMMGNGKRPTDPGYGVGDVPVLDISDGLHEMVGLRHDEALDPDVPVGLLTGTVLVLDNPRPVGAPTVPDRTVFGIGASTLHEAATEVVGAFTDHGSGMPTWVFCADAELAEVIAEHFTVPGYNTCRVIEELPS